MSGSHPFLNQISPSKRSSLVVRMPGRCMFIKNTCWPELGHRSTTFIHLWIEVCPVCGCHVPRFPKSYAVAVQGVHSSLLPGFLNHLRTSIWTANPHRLRYEQNLYSGIFLPFLTDSRNTLSAFRRPSRSVDFPEPMLPSTKRMRARLGS